MSNLQPTGMTNKQALRLEYFKAAKDKTMAVVLRWKPPHAVLL